MVGLVAQHEVERVDERPVVVSGARADARHDLGRERLQRGIVARDATRERGRARADRASPIAQRGPASRRMSDDPGARVAAARAGRRRRRRLREWTAVRRGPGCGAGCRADRARRRSAPCASCCGTGSRPVVVRDRRGAIARGRARTTRRPGRPRRRGRRRTRARTAPRGAAGRARSSATGTAADAASGASTALAAVSTSALLRQLVSSAYCAHARAAARTLRGKPPRLPADAPRQP